MSLRHEHDLCIRKVGKACIGYAFSHGRLAERHTGTLFKLNSILPLTLPVREDDAVSVCVSAYNSRLNGSHCSRF